MFERLAHTMYRARWTVIAIWAVLLVISLPFVPRVGSVLKGGGFDNGTSESDRATDTLVDDLGFFRSSLTVIFSSDHWLARDPRFQRAMKEALQPAAKLPHVVRVETYYRHSAFIGDQQLVSDDNHAALAVLQYSITFDRAQTLVPQVRATLHSNELKVLVAGDAAAIADMLAVSNRDLQKVETYTFPIAIILLVLIFGSLVASTLPVLTGAVSVATTLALLFAIGHVTDLSVFSLNVSSMIGLGVGMDYALFVVSRFREEVHRRPVEDAVVIAMTGAGHAVLFSGLTVMIGLCGLLIFHSMALRSIGLGGSLVVLISVIAALTLLPALLSVLGTRIDSLPIIRWRRAGASPFWHGIATRVMRHPWPVIAVTLLIAVLVASPFRLLQLSVPDATILPKSVPSRQGFDILNVQFHQRQNNPLIVVVTAQGDILAPSNMAALYDYVQILRRDPGVRSDAVKSLVTLPATVSRDTYVHLANYRTVPDVAGAIHFFSSRHSTFFTLPPKSGVSAGQLEDLVKRVREVPIGNGLQRSVGGYNAGVMDYLSTLYSQFPFTVAFVIVVTYLVLLVLLRSVILPLKAVLMNALSMCGSYGAVVWIFQQGHLSRLLNFSPTGYVDEITPIIMFCTLFGLSMDYEVFLLSRVREQYLATGDNAASVAMGLERTGRIITSAALVLVVVAGSFAFTDIVLIKAVGLSLAIAIFLDATLIRCMLVPATMRVLGRWNWWMPQWLHRVFGEKPSLPAPEAGGTRQVA